jgi:nucleotide-binding universal stress UspA family protein
MKICAAVQGAKDIEMVEWVGKNIAQDKDQLTILHVDNQPNKLKMHWEPINQNKANESELLSLIKTKDIPCDFCTLFDIDPRQGIVEFCKENEIELVCVGKRGTGGIKQLLVGSVADYVIHYGDVPILVYDAPTVKPTMNKPTVAYFSSKLYI